MVGAGGAGLRAAVGLAESGLETACISKLVSKTPPAVDFTTLCPILDVPSEFEVCIIRDGDKSED